MEEEEGSEYDSEEESVEEDDPEQAEIDAAIAASLLNDGTVVEDI